jgi:hypothetical protein
MGNVEDVRKGIQDFIAPDLKAIAIRIEALENEMKLRFTSATQQASSFEKEVGARFIALESEIKLRFASTSQQISYSEKETNARLIAIEKETNLRFTSAEQLAASRHETVMNAMSAHHVSIMNSLEIEKRLARLESDRVRLSSGDQEQ